jgi:hypothetical protein
MPPRPIDNERKACDAVARSLEDLASAKRSNAHSPEDDKVGPPVEYVFDLGSQKYALEHTIVEAFDGQIRTDVDFASFIAPITLALDQKLPPPGKFDLCFSIHPSKGMNAKAIAKTQANIIAWVEKNAAELHAEHPDQPDRRQKPRGHRSSRKGVIDGVELLLTRETGWWMPDRAKGRLFLIRFAPKDHEALRPVRLKKAADAKLLKLNRWKTHGARSVLVLENGDMALSNHGVILDGIEDAFKGRADPPDEVWLVDTTIKKEWTVWCLLRDGLSFPDEESSVRFRDFNPGDLTSV